MCEGDDYCESFEETRKWLAEKYIVLLTNQARFDKVGWFENACMPESSIKFIPISS
jgi:hypothetical protein